MNKTYQFPNGDKIPLLGLGTWKMDDEVAEQAVAEAIRIGYRHVDGAWIYLNENGVGRGIAKGIADAGLKRSDIWLTSKLWNDCHRPEHVRGGIEKTLRDLNMDYLDLYLIHWPVAHQFGIARPESGDEFVSLDEIPLRETWEAMLELVPAGLCRHVGVSNFSVSKLKEVSASGTTPEVNQVESHPLLQQLELKQFCEQNGILMTAYSPLGSGDRPEPLKKDQEPNLFTLQAIVELANQHDTSPAQILLAWAIQRGTAVIPKAANPQHLLDNFKAQDVELSATAMASIEKLNENYRYVDGLFWEREDGPYTAAQLWA